MKLFYRSWQWVALLLVGVFALSQCGRRRSADPAPLTPYGPIHRNIAY